MMYLGVPAPEVIIGPQITQEIMLEEISRRGYAAMKKVNGGKGDKERVKYAYRVISSGRNERNAMCSLIRNFMMQQEAMGQNKKYLWYL